MVGTEGRVYSIEAHPRIYQYLLDNLKLNKLSNVEPFNYAMGNKPDAIVFSNSRSDDQNRILNSGEGITIFMKQLDDLPIEEPEINLLKIDVEGYELFVILGALRLLDITHCIYFESYEEHVVIFGYKTNDIIHLLHQKGFSCFKFTDCSTIAKISTGYTSKTCENLVAIKDIQLFLTRTGFTCEETT